MSLLSSTVISPRALGRTEALKNLYSKIPVQYSNIFADDTRSATEDERRGLMLITQRKRIKEPPNATRRAKDPLNYSTVLCVCKRVVILR